jgi:hypothetical protein
MRPLQIRLRTLVGLVAAVAIVCGWVVAGRQSSAPRPAERIAAAVLTAKAARPASRHASSDDLVPPIFVALVVLAAARVRRRLCPKTH